MERKVQAVLDSMKNAGVRNYATSGLTSHLLGGEGYGRVRLFTSDRNTREWITPHSHRYDFACLVLSGVVLNMTYTPAKLGHEDDMEVCSFWGSSIRPLKGGFGRYDQLIDDAPGFYSETRASYREGDWYYLHSDEIHSIEFNKQARVLFFEGPEKSLTSRVLEPCSNGVRVPTFTTAPWMFEKVPDNE